MRKVFLDTNVLIDFLGKREPFAQDIYQVFEQRSKLGLELCVSTLSFTTIYYVLHKSCAHDQLLELLDGLCSIVSVLPVDKEIILAALRSDFSDFEDAVQYYTALKGGAEVILTRNVKDYAKSEIKVLTPRRLLG